MFSFCPNIYFAFLILGCYFIHQGKVVERYLIERTDFSIYSEPMSELPTLSTYTLPYDRLLYGKDFNISYGVEGSIEKNLSFGTNKISKTLKVDFEQIYGMSVFKITPLNFSDNIPLDYKLTYYFEQSLILSNKQTLQVGIWSVQKTILLQLAINSEMVKRMNYIWILDQ